MERTDQEFGRELGEHTGFEALMADLSVRFINLKPEKVDEEIEDAQRRFCQNLAVDGSGLFQQFEDEPGALLLTHWYEPSDVAAGQPELERRAEPKLRTMVYWVRSAEAVGRAYTRIDAKVLFPWVYRQVQSGQAVLVTCPDELPPEAAQDRETFHRYGTKSMVVLPLATGSTTLGCLSFASLRQARTWSPLQVGRCRFVAQVFTHALARKRADLALARSYAQIKELKDRLEAESDYLKTEIEVSQPHHEIIGQSRAIREALHLVEQVAPTASAVLLTGETGTGKELLARAIHRLSPRRDRLMVEVNCAALPETLVESELFGRERGAYTGALTSQVGRFEVADGSTIFLDEVGELPLEVQAKLLRVLQEGKFQRLGDPKTHQVNVRVIAATNHDLAEAVRRGHFREDLFYRLNVFPIHVPPLRERPEDIPLLMMAFVEEFSSRMGKPGLKVPRRVMQALESHNWPGNIRELRNVIERGVILSPGDSLHLALLHEGEQPNREPSTLAEAERQHILRVLERTSWRIKGPHGAARPLGLKPGTLYSRMRKLGIPHRREKDAIATPGRDFNSVHAWP